MRRLGRSMKFMRILRRILMRTLPLHLQTANGSTHPRPKGAYDSTLQYLCGKAHHSADQLIPVFPGEIVARKLPASLGAHGLPPEFANHRFATVPPTSLAILHDIRFWGHYGGSVIGRDNRLIGDLSLDIWGLPLHTTLASFALPKLESLPGNVAVLSTPEAESNYWHWMTACLPKLFVLEKAGYTPDRIDYYLTNAELNSFQLETLAWFNVPRSKLVQVGSDTHLRLHKALIPSTHKDTWDIPEWFPSFVERCQSQPKMTLPRDRRIYISRAEDRMRQLSCEAAILPDLQRRHFEIVQPARMSVAEQMNLFERATDVVAPHGAGMTNLMFSKPGTRVLDLMSGDWPGLYFWGLSESFGLSYTVLRGKPLVGDQDRFSRIEIPPEEIISALDRWELQSFGNRQ